MKYILVTGTLRALKYYIRGETDHDYIANVSSVRKFKPMFSIRIFMTDFEALEHNNPADVDQISRIHNALLNRRANIILNSHNLYQER